MLYELYHSIMIKCIYFLPVIWLQYFDGLMQERGKSIANALELHLSCTNPLIWFHSPDINIGIMNTSSQAGHFSKWYETTGGLSQGEKQTWCKDHSSKNRYSRACLMIPGKACQNHWLRSYKIMLILPVVKDHPSWETTQFSCHFI